MDEFLKKLVEVNSWVTSYFMEPYDSYKRRKGYMDKMLKGLAEAMGMVPDSRLVPVLQYMADVVSNQMGLGKTEPERETFFSVMAELLNSLMDLLTRLREEKDVRGYDALRDRVFDVLDMLHFSVKLRALRDTQRLISALYSVADAALKRGEVPEKVLTAMDEVLFLLSQSEEEGLTEAIDVLRGLKV